MSGRPRAAYGRPRVGARGLSSAVAQVYAGGRAVGRRTGGRHICGAPFQSINRHCELRARPISHCEMKSQNCYDGSMFRLKSIEEFLFYGRNDGMS